MGLLETCAIHLSLWFKMQGERTVYWGSRLWILGTVWQLIILLIVYYIFEPLSSKYMKWLLYQFWLFIAKSKAFKKQTEEAWCDLLIYTIWTTASCPLGLARQSHSLLYTVSRICPFPTVIQAFSTNQAQITIIMPRFAILLPVHLHHQLFIFQRSCFFAVLPANPHS